jgi:transcriptional regulator with XRE-family HTH domain
MKPERTQQLGQLLKARREERGLSTHRLARAAEMDQATIFRL